MQSLGFAGIAGKSDNDKLTREASNSHDDIIPRSFFFSFHKTLISQRGLAFKMKTCRFVTLKIVTKVLNLNLIPWHVVIYNEDRNRQRSNFVPWKEDGSAQGASIIGDPWKKGIT
jgi:hypothetical protein